MLKERIHSLRNLHLVTDLALTCIAYLLAYPIEQFYRTGVWAGISFQAAYPEESIALCVIWAVLILRDRRIYAYRTRPIRAILASAARLSGLGSVWFWLWLYASGNLTQGRVFFVAFLVLDFGLLFALRLAVVTTLAHFRRRGRNLQTVLIVGTGQDAKDLIDKVIRRPHWGIRILGLLDWNEPVTWRRYRDIPLIGALSQLPELIKTHQVDYVVFAVSYRHLDRIDESLAICEEMGVRACLLADFFNSRIGRRELREFFGKPAVVYDTTPPANWRMSVKNLTDRLGATVGLLASLPLLGAIALLVKVTSRGPVFFKQVRCGLNGRRFRMLKFRTMVRDAERLKATLVSQNEMDGPAFKIKEDPRVTPLGRFLRRTSLDELPQLINVVKGDMSLVGPRPPLPEEVKLYDRWHRRRLSVRPGMTCLWQVGARNDTSFDDWMKLDLEYIDRWSPVLDAKIMLKTIGTVLRRTGR